MHVERDANTAKYWLSPVRLVRAGAFTTTELLRIERIVQREQDRLLKAWNEYFFQ